MTRQGSVNNGAFFMIYIYLYFSFDTGLRPHGIVPCVAHLNALLSIKQLHSIAACSSKYHHVIFAAMNIFGR